MAEVAAQIRMPVERVAPDAIRLERLLDAPPETVWRYLTEAELRGQWFMGGTDATPGGEFDLRVDHDRLSDDKNVPYPDGYAQFKGTVWAEKVVRFEPPRLLETTFQSGKNGRVRFELFSEGAQTRLVITHSGIESPTGSQDFVYVVLDDAELRHADHEYAKVQHERLRNWLEGSEIIAR